MYVSFPCSFPHSDCDCYSVMLDDVVVLYQRLSSLRDPAHEHAQGYCCCCCLGQPARAAIVQNTRRAPSVVVE